MKAKFILIGILFFSILTNAQNYKQDSVTLKQMSNRILADYDCYKDLNYLCKQIGNRISGSEQATKAVEWGKKTLESTGCTNVFLQEVFVPHWIRGKEEASITTKNGNRISLKISSLGNAVGTGENGLQAPVLKVNNMDELKRMNAKDVKANENQII